MYPFTSASIRSDVPRSRRQKQPNRKRGRRAHRSQPVDFRQQSRDRTDKSRQLRQTLVDLEDCYSICQERGRHLDPDVCVGSRSCANRNPFSILQPEVTSAPQDGAFHDQPDQLLHYRSVSARDPGIQGRIPDWMGIVTPPPEPAVKHILKTRQAYKYGGNDKKETTSLEISASVRDSPPETSLPSKDKPVKDELHVATSPIYRVPSPLLYHKRCSEVLTKSAEEYRHIDHDQNTKYGRQVEDSSHNPALASLDICGEGKSDDRSPLLTTTTSSCYSQSSIPPTGNGWNPNSAEDDHRAAEIHPSSCSSNGFIFPTLPNFSRFGEKPGIDRQCHSNDALREFSALVEDAITRSLRERSSTKDSLDSQFDVATATSTQLTKGGRPKQPELSEGITIEDQTGCGTFRNASHLAVVTASLYNLNELGFAKVSRNTDALKSSLTTSSNGESGPNIDACVAQQLKEAQVDSAVIPEKGIEQSGLYTCTLSRSQSPNQTDLEIVESSTKHISKALNEKADGILAEESCFEKALIDHHAAIGAGDSTLAYDSMTEISENEAAVDVDAWEDEGWESDEGETELQERLDERIGLFATGWE